MSSLNEKSSFAAISHTGRFTRTFFSTAMFLALAMLLGATPALADPVISITQCGTVISQPGQYILDADLKCQGNGINIVADHVVLVLNSHKIGAGFASSPEEVADFAATDTTDTADTMNAAAAPATTFGISVGVGVAAGNSHVHIVGPGTIFGFNTAIRFEAVSFSSIADVTATKNMFGFGIAAGFTSGCSTCLSTKNNFQGNSVTGNARSGFLLNGADNNNIQDNDATGNVINGMILFGANKNNLQGNTVSKSATGIFVQIATGNHIHDNTTSGNKVGILATKGTGTGNFIHDNTSQSNSALDLEDDNASCDNNTWKDNIFGTASQGCIQ